MSEIWSNLVNNQGLELALAGIVVVFAALLLVSLYIALLPKILKGIAPLLDRKAEGLDDALDAECAAVAAAMHAHLNRKES